MKIKISAIYVFSNYYIDFIIKHNFNSRNVDDYICNSIKIDDHKLSLMNGPFENVENFNYKLYRKLANENKNNHL